MFWGGSILIVFLELVEKSLIWLFYCLFGDSKLVGQDHQGITLGDAFIFLFDDEETILKKNVKSQRNMILTILFYKIFP